MAVQRLDASREPAQARAAGRIGAADAVVGDVTVAAPFERATLTRRAGRVRVLGDVRDRLGDDVVRRRLDRRRQPLVRERVDSTGSGARAASGVQRRAEPALGEDDGVDAAGQLAQLVEPAGEVGLRGGQQLAGACGSLVELARRPC